MNTNLNFQNVTNAANLLVAFVISVSVVREECTEERRERSGEPRL